VTRGRGESAGRAITMLVDNRAGHVDSGTSGQIRFAEPPAHADGSRRCSGRSWDSGARRLDSEPGCALSLARPPPSDADDETITWWQRAHADSERDRTSDGVCRSLRTADYPRPRRARRDHPEGAPSSGSRSRRRLLYRGYFARDRPTPAAERGIQPVDPEAAGSRASR